MSPGVGSGDWTHRYHALGRQWSCQFNIKLEEDHSSPDRYCYDGHQKSYSFRYRNRGGSHPHPSFVCVGVTKSVVSYSIRNQQSESPVPPFKVSCSRLTVQHQIRGSLRVLTLNKTVQQQFNKNKLKIII